MSVTTLLTATYVVGISAEAMTAALSAGRQRLDFFAVSLLAAITAFGGGTVRDVLLGHYPLVWVDNPVYLIVVLVAAAVTVSLSFFMHYFRSLFLALDAVGLAAFTVLGTQVALSEGHGPLIAIVAAICTGVFGGILRDILSDRVPLVFMGDLYAACALIGSVTYMVLEQLGAPPAVVIPAGLIVTFAVRMWAVKYNKSMPIFAYNDENQPVDPRLRLSAQFVRETARKAKSKVARGIKPDSSKKDDGDGDAENSEKKRPKSSES